MFGLSHRALSGALVWVEVFVVRLRSWDCLIQEVAARPHLDSQKELVDCESVSCDPR